MRSTISQYQAQAEYRAAKEAKTEWIEKIVNVLFNLDSKNDSLYFSLYSEVLRKRLDTLTFMGSGLDFEAQPYANLRDLVIDGKIQSRKHLRALLGKVPHSVIGAGSEAVAAWLRSTCNAIKVEVIVSKKIVNQHLPTARVVLLGESDVGKTSFLRRLRGLEIQPSEAPTPGIEVHEVEEKIKAQSTPTQVHYWDFGGQVFLHSSHQFFLRERCIYIVMVKARTAGDKELLEYWLEHVRIYGGGSPTIVIQNQVDIGEGFDDEARAMAREMPFDRTSLQKKYGFVKGFFNLSCAKDWGLAAVKAALVEELTDVRILNDATPSSWYEAKTQLRTEFSAHTSIDQTKFNAILAQVGIDQRDYVGVSRAFDQLGIALNFPNVDPDWYVLDPSWLSRTIYFLLWHSKGFQWRATLNEMTLRTVFDKSRFADAPDVPADKFGTLLKLLGHFELAYAYNLAKGDWRVPMLSPEDTTPQALALDDRPATLSFTLRMDTLLPPVLFHRYVTRCGAEIVGENIWQTGCMLAQGGAQALIRQDKQKRHIEIRTYGGQAACGRYLEVLRLRLLELIGGDRAHRSLDFETTLGFSDNGRLHEVDYLELLHRAQNDKSEILTKREGVEFQTAQLLSIVFTQTLTLQNLMLEVALLKRDRSSEHPQYVQHQPAQIHIHNTISPAVSVEQNQSVQTKHVSNQVLNASISIHLVQQLKNTLHDLDFGLDSVSKPALVQYESDIAKAKLGIKRVQEMVTEYEAAPDRSAPDQPLADKPTLLARIKNVGGAVMRGIEHINELSSFANTIQDILDKFPT